LHLREEKKTPTNFSRPTCFSFNTPALFLSLPTHPALFFLPTSFSFFSSSSLFPFFYCSSAWGGRGGGCGDSISGDPTRKQAPQEKI
jgi:hypothetical protein